MRHYNSN